MSNTLFEILVKHAAAQTSIDDAAALSVLRLENHELPRLLAITSELRRSVFGDVIRLCSIVNARSGLCAEDCRFCAQSLHYPDAPREVYSMCDVEALAAAYDQGAERPIEFFSIVTSGGTLPRADLDAAIEAMRSRKGAARWCASLGCLDETDLQRLREAGMVRYHHNLETARSFFDRICTTHSYDSRIETVRAAKRAGLEVCSGGLLGMGESLEQRVELARTLTELEVDSIPLNFLIPIPGTPLEHLEPMSPMDILRCIAMTRLVNPTRDVRIAGGRPHLRRLQAMIFHAGCNGMMVGDLLTTPGENVEDDLRMLRDLGLTASIDS